MSDQFTSGYAHVVYLGAHLGTLATLADELVDSGDYRGHAVRIAVEEIKSLRERCKIDLKEE